MKQNQENNTIKKTTQAMEVSNTIYNNLNNTNIVEGMSKSWISRSESAALKGFLLMLIIMGHLRGIAFPFQNYLYCFHVQCFFILPFLYPAKKLTYKNILNLGLKLLWPFLILYVLQILLAVYVLHDSYFQKPEDLIPGVSNTFLGVWSVFTGGITLINQFCATQFLWFLPAFFAVSVIRMWYYTYRHDKLMKYLIFSLGAVCYVVYSVYMFGASYIPEKYLLISQALSPFSIWQGLGYFTLGMAVFYIIKRWKPERAAFYWSAVGMFTLLYVFFNSDFVIFRVIKFFFPVIFFIAIYSSRQFLGSFRFIRNIGNHSFAIYIISSILCIVFGMMIPAAYTHNPIVLALEFGVILMLSYAGAVIIEKIPTLRKMLFPRGEDFGTLLRGNI